MTWSSTTLKKSVNQLQKQPKQDQVEEEDPYSDIEEYEESAADVDVEDDRDEL